MFKVYEMKINLLPDVEIWVGTGVMSLYLTPKLWN